MDLKSLNTTQNITNILYNMSNSLHNSKKIDQIIINPSIISKGNEFKP